MDRKIRSDRFSYRDAPYRRDSRRGFRFSDFLNIYILFLLSTYYCGLGKENSDLMLN